MRIGETVAALGLLLVAAGAASAALGQGVLERPIASAAASMEATGWGEWESARARRGWDLGGLQPGTGLAVGAGQDGEVVPSRLSWTLQVEPRAWFSALAGDIRVPGLAGNAELDLVHLELDEPALRPALKLSAKRDKWRISVGGFWIEEEVTLRDGFEGEIGGRSFGEGSRVDASIEFASASVSGGYEMIHYTGGAGEARFDVESIVELIGGVRLYHLDVDVAAESEQATATASADQLFAEPFVGVRWVLELLHDFSIESEVSAGGFAGGSDYTVFSLDISTQMAWRPHPNVGVLFGYRQLAFDLEQGEHPTRVGFGGSNAGLYGGLHLRF